MTLAEYITEVGDDHAAAVLGIKPRTAAAYRRGERRPRAKKAQEIVKRLGGRVSLAGIYVATD